VFQQEYLLSILPKLAEAAWVNLQLALLIAVISLASAIALTILRTMKFRVVGWTFDVVASFVRGTPLLVQIFLCYYVLPSIGIDLEPLSAGVLAISLNSTVFVSETMRGGLQTIDPGQIEASLALGLGRSVIWHRVLLPQLLIRILPMLVNELTIIIKATALLSVITVVEVMRTAQQFAAATFRPFESLVGAGLVFLVMNGFFILIATVIEARLKKRAI
jgi:His/Glu/Gln/Arg/opine family amino acid ABC transporter permease subunit